MAGKSEAAREQLLALVKRPGRASSAMETFLTSITGSVRDINADRAVQACLKLLEAAVSCRRSDWITALRIEGQRATKEAKKDVVFAAKLAQSVIRAYAAATAKSEHQEDIATAMDLACMALYMVCLLEHTVKLGELVVDNLMYQVAKKYAELPVTQLSAICVAACIRIRLWTADAKLSKGEKCGAISMMSIVLDDDGGKDLAKNMAKRLQVLADLPTPRDCHSEQFAKLVLGHTNTCLSLMNAAKQYESILFTAKNTMSPWIEHLHRLPGDNSKLISSLSDRTFRILWKSASTVENGAQKTPEILSTALRFREAALLFLLKCSNYTSSYFIQQVNRVGIQHERASKKSELGLQEVTSFYIRSANALALTQTKSRHLYSSKVFQWEYIQWFEHFALICDQSGQEMESVMILDNAIQYAQPFGDQGKSIQYCLLFSLAGSLLSHAGSVDGKGFCRLQNEDTEFWQRMEAGISKIIYELVHDISAEGWSSRVEKAARVCLKKVESLDALFDDITRKHAGFVSFMTRCIKRSSAKLFNYTVNVQYSAKYKLHNQVILSFDEMAKTLRKVRAVVSATESKTNDELVVDESRLYRMAVVLLVRGCINDKADISKLQIKALYRHVTFVRELLDEATMDGKPSEVILQGVLSDLKSIAREWYGLATCCYKTKNYQDTISALTGAFELAESYLEYVMCSDFNAAQIHNAHVQLKVDAIVSLLAHCFHEMDDIPKARKFTSYSLIYCGTINDKIPQSTVEKFASLVVEELKVEKIDVIICNFKGFVDNASHVFKARHIAEDQITELWRALRVAFEQSGAKVMIHMRIQESKDEDVADEASQMEVVDLCCALEGVLDDILMKPMENAENADLYRAVLTQASKALSKRKWSYCAYYGRHDYTSAIEGLEEAHRSLCAASEKLQRCASADSDLGGLFGWRGVITMEIMLMRSYAIEEDKMDAYNVESISEESAIADFERCMMYWGHCDRCGFFFDGSRVVCCMEAVCNSLSLISCLALEAAARNLLKSHQGSMGKKASSMSAVPPPLLFLLDTNFDERVVKVEEQLHYLPDNECNVWEQFEQVDAQIAAAATSSFTDPFKRYQHLLNAITAIHDKNTGLGQLRKTTMLAKAVGMRELLIHVILSDIHLSEGRIKSAVAEAKAALKVCFKLARKLVAPPPNDVASMYELPPAISGSQDHKPPSANSTPILYFKALEFSSWDLLFATKLSLCRLASLFSLSGQQHRAETYLTEAMRLVGGLNLHFFRRSPFYEYAELKLNSQQLEKAKMAISLLSESADKGISMLGSVESTILHRSCKLNSPFIEQHCNELIQRGDVLVVEGETKRGLDCYMEAVRTLAEANDITSKPLSRVTARCWRKSTSLKTRISDLSDAAAVDDLLVSMKKLKHSMKTCDAQLERIKCMLVLGHSNVRLLRSSSSRAFTTLDRSIALLEEAFVLGDSLGIPHLSQSLRVTLGTAYFAKLEETTNIDTDPMDGGSSARYLAWASSTLLANSGCIDPGKSDVTEDADASSSLKDRLTKQLETITADSGDMKDRSYREQLVEMTETISERTSEIPKSWLIVALSIGLCSELVITRFQTNGAAPISFCLPSVAWAKCMQEMDSIVTKSREILSDHTAEEGGSWTTDQKKEWWITRKSLDERLQEAISRMQTILGFWRCLLVKGNTNMDNKIVQHCWTLIISTKAGPIKLARRNQSLLCAIADSQWWLSDDEILDGIKHIAAEIGAPITKAVAQEVLQVLRQIDEGHGSYQDEVNPLTTNHIAEMKISELKHHLASVGLSTDGLKKVLVERLMAAHQDASRNVFSSSINRCSTILVLNHELQEFPWEGLDVMNSCCGVTRMPSLDLILQNARKAASMPQASCSVRRNNVRFLLNPAGDLKATQSQLGPILEDGAATLGWKGIVGEVPDPDKLRNYLLDADLYIYCGHGSGEAYLHRDKILALESQCSAALLFGCSSGRLEREGIFGPSGAVLSYLRARSPAVLAMLWDVTDRDIDQLSVKILRDWLLADSDRNLAQVLHDGRKVCKLKYLNGHAAVCYGLPLRVTSG